MSQSVLLLTLSNIALWIPISIAIYIIKSCSVDPNQHSGLQYQPLLSGSTSVLLPTLQTHWPLGDVAIILNV